VGGFSAHPDFQPINLDMLVEKQELKQTPQLPRRCWTGGVSFSMALIRNNLVPPGWLQSGGRLCEEWPRGKTPVVVGSFLGWLAGWLVGWLVPSEPPGVPQRQLPYFFLFTVCRPKGHHIILQAKAADER